MGAGSTAIVLIGVLVIAFVLFGSQLGFGSNFFGNISNSIRDLLAKFGIGSGGGGTGGAVAIGFTVYFAHGQPPAYINESVLPLSVFYNSLPVSSIQIDVKAEITGITSAWQSTTNMNVEFDRTAPGPEPNLGSFDQNYTQSASSWTNGTVKTLATMTLTNAQMTTIIGTHVSTWQIHVSSIVYMNAQVGGKQTTFNSSPATAYLDIAEATDTSLSISSAGSSQSSIIP